MKTFMKDELYMFGMLFITVFSSIYMYNSTATWLPIFRILFLIIWIPSVLLGGMDLGIKTKIISKECQKASDRYIEDCYSDDN